MTPFPTLTALRAAHTDLAKRAKPPGTALALLPAVREFVAQAVATGTVLDARDERDAAGSLISYWLARTGSEARLADPPSLEPFGPNDNTLLAEYNPATARAAVAAADARLAELKADPGLVRRLLLRLVRLRPNDPGGNEAAPVGGPVFDAVPSARSGLYELADEAQVNPLVEALDAAGVLRVTPGATRADDQIELRPAVLTTDWDRLRAAETSRRRFRRHAAIYRRPAAPTWWAARRRADVMDGLFWYGQWLDRAAPPAGYGLTLNELNEAEEYQDLNATEVRYLQTGRALQRRLYATNRAFARLAVWALVVIAALFVAALFNTYRARQESRLARAAEKAAETAKQDAVDALERERMAQAEAKLAGEAKARVEREAERQQAVLMQEQTRTISDFLSLKESDNTAQAQLVTERYTKRRDDLLTEQAVLVNLRNPSLPLRPGARVWLATPDRADTSCSVCCVLKAADGRRLALVFGGPGTTPGGLVSRREKGQQPVGRVVAPSELGGAVPANPDSLFAFVLLDPGVAADNRLAKTDRSLRAVARGAAVGDEVELLGSGSGLNRAQVQKVDGEEVSYTRVSTIGDAGGPLVNAAGELVAMHVGGREGASFARLVGRLLAGLRLELVP